MTLIDKAEAPFFFDRYINGVRMAEDVCIERETTLEGAMRVAARIAAKGPNGEPPVLVYRTTDAAHVNEPPKSEHDAGNVLTDAAQAREAALSVLSGLSSYLGAGLGNDDTTPEQYDKRIRWGIDHQIAVTVQRCADVIEELSKEAYSGKRVHWGQIKQAILAVSPAIAALPAAVPGMKPLEIAGDDKYLILKRGMYYRPNAQGYTSNPGEAGRYTLAQAVFHTHPNGPDGPRDGMSFVPLAAALIGEPRT